MVFKRNGNRFGKAVNLGTKQPVNQRKMLIFLGRRRTHKLFAPVSRLVVPGQPDPHQCKKFMLMYLVLFLHSGRKQPREKAFGHDVRRRSWTHKSGYPCRWPWDVPDKSFMQGTSCFCCFREGMAGMSRNLGRDIPGSEKLYARN